MKELNEIGKQCPIPVIDAKAAVESSKKGDEIKVIVDNEIATQNLKKLADQKDIDYKCDKINDKEYHVLLTVKHDGNKESVSADMITIESCSTGPMVVIISSDTMGHPEEELGHVLMKGFILALTKTENRPDKIIFYNGGAKLTCEGSESLEDLKVLESEGVQIMTCGTCLKFQNIEDKLKVGTVTNMYEIAENMTSAGKIVKP